MKGDIFEAWILQLNNKFKGQNRNVIMILDNTSSHVVSSAKVGKSCGFSTLELSNMDFCYKHSSTFGSRYNSIFQTSIQEETFAQSFITLFSFIIKFETSQRFQLVFYINAQ